MLERYAVRCGGGHNHRFSLSDAVLAKDNHLAVLTGGDPGKLTAALAGVRAQLPHTVHFEVEVDGIEQIEPVLAAGVDTIMLDNFSNEQLVEGVALVNGRALVEASGNVNLAHHRRHRPNRCGHHFRGCADPQRPGPGPGPGHCHRGLSLMIFLDAAATTPVRREAIEAMFPFLTNQFGNPSSHHELGELAATALDAAREQCAAVLGCHAEELVFTSGGTEADNLALKGIALAAPGRRSRPNRVLISAIEHPAIADSADYLRRVHGFAGGRGARGPGRPGGPGGVCRDAWCRQSGRRRRCRGLHHVRQQRGGHGSGHCRPWPAWPRAARRTVPQRRRAGRGLA